MKFNATAPLVTFASIVKEKKLPIYLGLYEDEALHSSLMKAVENEDYDAAAIFRDELQRRKNAKSINLNHA